MSSTAGIVIVGGGVIGASVAYHLSMRGETDVLILESGTRQGLGSTGKATGGVRTQFETDVNVLMSKYSIDFFRKCEFDCGYEPAGYLIFATEQNQLESLRRSVANQKRLGVSGIEMIDDKSIGEMIPGMKCEDILGGSFGARDGFIDPLAVMRGFTNEATERGVKIEHCAPAISIGTRNGKARSVVTANGRIDCGKVIICSGAWSARIAATAGVRLPVEPLRRQIVWARSRQKLHFHMPMVIDAGTGFHFRPARDLTSNENAADQILMALPDVDERPSFITDFDESFIEKVYKIAGRRAGFLTDSDVVTEKCRAGLYENTPDHHAIIGGCDVSGLYFACGFSGHGVMHSPAAGRAVSDAIIDGESETVDVSSLNVGRFTSGSLLHETSFF
ncbi:MAG: NAD(P)/FAD-dependent oxidoreductase [Pyrinomonadaceae bacterium]